MGQSKRVVRKVEWDISGNVREERYFLLKMIISLHKKSYRLYFVKLNLFLEFIGIIIS